MTTRTYKQAKASVYIGNDDVAWLVVETPSEVAMMVRMAGSDDLLELTLGNRSDWNSKPLYVRARCITSIGPPKFDKGEEEEESE